MTLWLALRRLLPLLAVLSLALTPVAAPAATAGMHAAMASSHHAAAMREHGMAGMVHSAMGHPETASAEMAGMDMDDMPCCPKADDSRPDCAKGCPLMALCLASTTYPPPAELRLTAPVARRADVTWPEPASPSSVHGVPSPEPPRA